MVLPDFQKVFTTLAKMKNGYELGKQKSPDFPKVGGLLGLASLGLSQSGQAGLGVGKSVALLNPA